MWLMRIKSRGDENRTRTLVYYTEPAPAPVTPAPQNPAPVYQHLQFFLLSLTLSMPGPRQGKHSQKRKWHENTFNLDANMASVNAVMTAPSTTAPNTRTATLSTLPPNVVTTAVVLTDETASKTGSYTALLTTTTDAVTTTAGAAANNANNVTHIDTATAVLPANDESLQPLEFTYSHEEVQELLEDARLDGYQEGFKEGHKTGRKTGHKEGKEDGYEGGYNKGSRKWGEGYREGYKAKGKLNQEKEERVWKEGLLEGYELGMQNGKDEE